MHYKALVLALSLACVGASAVAEAASPCDREATRKRNHLEKLCYRAMGPVSGIWSLEPAHQTKLEQCLMRTKVAHIVERDECGKNSEIGRSGK